MLIGVGVRFEITVDAGFTLIPRFREGRLFPHQARGKEFMLWIFRRSCYIQPKLYLKCPNTYPSQPIKGKGL